MHNFRYIGEKLFCEGVAVESLAAACRLFSLLRKDMGDFLTSFEFISDDSLALVLANIADTRVPLERAPAYVLFDVATAARGGESLRLLLETSLSAAISAGVRRSRA